MSSPPPPIPPETTRDVVPPAVADAAPGARPAARSRAGGRRPPSRRAARPVRWLAWSAFAALVLAAVSWIAIRDYVWPNLDRWRPAIERRIAESVGRPVKLGALITGFDGLRPRLVVRDVAIDDADGQNAFAATEVRAVLSLRSLLRGRPALALLEIDAPSLRVERLAPRRWRVAGVEFDPDDPHANAALEQLFAHRRVVLRQVRIDWRDRVSGESATVREVDIALGSVGRRHRASLRVPALLGAAAGVDAAIEFYRPPFTAVGDWRKWRGEAYVGAEGVELAALAQRWRAWHGDRPDRSSSVTGVALGAGQARLRAWSDFERGSVVDALVRIEAVGVEADFDGRRVPLRALSAEARADRQPDGSTAIAFGKLRLDDDRGLSWSAIDGESRLVLGSDGRAVAARLSLGRFDAAGLIGLATRLPLSSDLRSRIESLRVAGVVDRLAIDWAAQESPDSAGGPATSRYGVDLAFEKLSLQRVEAPLRPGELKLPGFANVSGTARLTERGGKVSLHGESVLLRFPGLFAEPEVPLDRLHAEANWTVGPAPEPGGASVVDVDIEAFRFAGADAAGEVGGRYRSGGKGAGIVDLRGRLDRADAARTARYLPLAIAADVRQWVGRAVLAGRSDDLRFVLKGDLEDFPFRDPASGEFRIDATLADAALAYAPGWPTIERIQGRLRFERAGMEIDVGTGRVRDVALTQTTARIAEFREPVLRIEGGGHGPAQDMVRFVNESPLLTRIDDFTRDLAISGDATLQLAFEMPLEDVDATRVTGSVRLDGNDLALDRTLPRIEGVTGRLEFSERALALRSLTATLLGGPVSVEGDTPEAGRFVLRAKGAMPADGIVQLVDNALTRRLAGSASYTAEIDVRGRASTLVIGSDLEGLSSALPAPFGKTADQKWPLRIEARPLQPVAPGERPARDTLTVALRDDVRLVFEREREPDSQQLVVRRGAFALADQPTLPDAGFAVLLRTSGIDLDAWNALLGDDLLASAQAGVAGGFSLLPETVSLVAGTVGVAGKTLHDVVLGASRLGGFWRANVRAREIDGYFSWRQAARGQAQGTLMARFARLEIPRDRIGEFETLLDTTPESLPALDVVAEDLILNDRRLGALELRAVNSGSAAAPVWQVQQLRIRNAAATLSASGSWQTRPGAVRRATAMDFELEMRDAGGLLTLFGFRDTLRAGIGRLNGQIRWEGSPLRLDYRGLEGELALELGNGQFLKTDPGIAKLIGVLNLQSLRRRLAFDFRDVFAEGFAFDRISGNARVEGGIARTEDFEMRGVAALVGIRGQADLAAETQSLLVEVRPDLNAGLASLAYAALANPAIGLGALLAQAVLRQPLQQLLAYEYEVTGSWSDPQVTPRSRPAAQAPPPGAP